MKYGENSLYFCRTNSSSSNDMNVDVVGRAVRPLIYLPRTTFFPVLDEKLNFSDENGKTQTMVTPVIFRFYVSTNFHYDRTYKKEKKTFLGVRSP